MSTEGLLIEHSRVFGSDVMVQPSDITDPSGLGFGFRVQGQEFSRPSENPLRPYLSNGELGILNYPVTAGVF